MLGLVRVSRNAVVVVGTISTGLAELRPAQDQTLRGSPKLVVTLENQSDSCFELA
jgi:hypothetical protein